ncbi:MAG: hypothetical protein EOP84_05185 [Verrucomicrobiaceae bacterium]|nr:MAG: hypothetical protein EOP84_05185 [Verrucomicrobiaceae bacterium]
MAKHVRFTPKKSPHGWRLNIPAKLSSTGKRQQLFYRTQALALAAADDMKEQRETFGAQARAIAPSVAEQAVAATALLEPWGISILEAARMVVAIREKETASRPMAEAAEAWLAACEGLRPRTILNYKLTVDRLRAVLGDRLMASLSADDLQKAIAPPGSSISTVQERIRNAKAFWRWSAKKGWCAVDTFAGVEVPKSGRDAEEISILAPDEAECLLRTAESHFPQAVATYALQLFAGIRAEEVIRLESKHVTPDGIDLPAGVTKKGRRRHITPSPTLASWLTAYPFTPCPNWRETSAACRRLAGWDLSARIVNDAVASGRMASPVAAHRGSWPQNALRHSHASYAVASRW